MKRRALIAVVALAVLLAPSAAAKTFKVEWRERKEVADATVDFRVTKIVVGARTWAVTLAIRNGTHAPLRVTTPARGTTPIPYTAVVSPTQYRGQTALVRNGVRSYDAIPSRLPRSIAAGATWTGTIAGRGALARGRYTLGLGWFEPLDPNAGGKGFYWVTDHSFRL